jgi:hypothetical protein
LNLEILTLRRRPISGTMLTILESRDTYSSVSSYHWDYVDHTGISRYLLFSVVLSLGLCGPSWNLEILTLQCRPITGTLLHHAQHTGQWLVRIAELFTRPRAVLVVDQWNWIALINNTRCQCRANHWKERAYQELDTTF